MRNTLITVALGASVIAPCASIAAADAATVGCVGHTEFQRIHDGMTKARVHRVFETRGVLVSSGRGSISREYDTCQGDDWSYVSVDYRWSNGAYRVSAKAEHISY